MLIKKWGSFTTFCTAYVLHLFTRKLHFCANFFATPESGKRTPALIYSFDGNNDLIWLIFFGRNTTLSISQNQLAFASNVPKLNFTNIVVASFGIDIIVLNSLKDEGAGFQHDSNKVTIIDRNNKVISFELKSKHEVAIDILDAIENY